MPPTGQSPASSVRTMESGRETPLCRMPSHGRNRYICRLAVPLGAMASEGPGYSTKELTRETLADFERLMEARPAPGAFMCWCLFHQRDPASAPDARSGSRSEEAARNRREKRELVERDRSHGILVYSDGEPVGWCQYGPREELPRFDRSPNYRKFAPNADPERMWRITCFVVDRKHRRRGVASAALKAALEAIRKRGGGLVEAYPITRLGAYREYLGTVSMFRREGFRIVGPFGENNVVMRKEI